MTILTPLDAQSSSSSAANDKTGTSPSSAEADGKEEHPLKVKRAEAIEAQQRLATLHVTLQQLEQLRRQTRAGSKSSSSLASSSSSSSSPSDRWSTATVLTGDNDDDDDDDDDDDMPSTPVSGPMGIVRLNVDAANAVMPQGSSLVVDEGSGEADTVAGGSSQRAVSVDAQTGKRVVEMPIEEAIALLSKNRSVLEARVAQLRNEVVQLARKTLAEHVGSGNLPPFLSSLGSSGHDGEDTNGGPKTQIDQEGKALNEEGLPFVDPIEQIDDNEEEGDDEEAGRTKKAVPLVPFVREPREDRKAWMESILGELEQEEEKTRKEEEQLEKKDGKVAEAALAPLATPEKNGGHDEVEEEEKNDDDAEDRLPRPIMQRKLSSADRPPPPKSVLKRTSPPPPPLPKFGSSGIRKGFLNLNPSSPAAEHSSDFVGRSYFPSEDRHATTSSLSSTSTRPHRSSSLSGKNRNERETAMDRMTRSVELPAGGASRQARTPSFSSPKKQVRIQSPEREKRAPPASSSSSLLQSATNTTKIAKATRNGREESMQMDEEASQLLELMGIDAIRAHPYGQEIIESFAESNRLRKAASKTVDDPSSGRNDLRERREKKEEEKMTNTKPAVGESVLERSTSALQSQSGKGSSNSSSGFKRGFLNAKPGPAPARKSVNQGALSDVVKEKKVSAVPVGPRQSLGITALDRATQADEPLERRREEMGLPPSVPHARPSKAYAAKLEEKRRIAAAAEASQEESDGGEKREFNSDKDKMPREDQVKEARPGGKVRFGGLEEVDVDDGDDDDDYTNADERKVGVNVEEIGQEHTGSDSDDDGIAAEIEAMNEQQLDRDELAALGITSDFSDDDDDDDGYNSDDIMALAPSFDADEASFGGNEELKREYLKAKERWGHFLTRQQSSKRGEQAESAYQEGEGQDLVGAEYDEEGEEEDGMVDENGKRVSRFKRERAKRMASGQGVAVSSELGSKHRSGEQAKSATNSNSVEDQDRRADEAGHELAHMLENAQNAGPEAAGEQRQQGPVMVIPAIANVRFPKGGNLVERQGEPKRMPGKVELDGESEEDDDRLHDIMRMRLEERDAYRDAKMKAGSADGGLTATRNGQKPPEVVAAAPPSASPQAPKKKKESLFKARLKDNVFSSDV